MDLTALKRDLDGIKVEDHPAIVQQKSRDFYWYSPVLKRELDHVKGDLIVSPKSEAEVIRVLAACHRHGVPVTPRGSGTGNYGQAMPLSGGVVLSLAEMNEVTSIGPGRVVTGPGAVLADIDRATRAHSGQELRMSPSTYNTASIGGFVAGGSGGVGSIRWGGLRDLGNVIRLRIVTMEAEPRVMELTGEDVLKVMHAYGTNGIITEVEMPLTASYDWIDVIVGFDDFMDAARFGNDLGIQDGILAKLITPIAAPIPYDYFKRHQKYLPPRAEHRRVHDRAARDRRFPRLHRARRGRDRVPRRQGAGSQGPAAGLRAHLEPHHAAGHPRRPDHHLSADALSVSRSSRPRRGDGEAFRRRGAEPSRISSASTARSAPPACRWCASRRSSGSTRSSASTRTMAAGSSTRIATRWRRAA